MFKDRWGGAKQIKFSCEYGDSGPEPIRCKEFMINGGEDWDIREVRQVFNDSDAKAIMECPINPISEDLQVWGPHSSGVYSVKSGYRWISNPISTQEDQSILWRTFASLPTLPKIRLFAWRLGYEAFPLGKKLAAAGLATGQCCMCQEAIETGLHAFRECPMIKEAFDLCDLSRLLPDGDFNSCKEWLECVISRMDQKQLTLFITLLWNFWNRRNKWLHDGQLIPHRFVVDYAQLISSDFLKAQEMALNEPESRPQERWMKPSQDCVKINVDGAFNPTTRRAAIGVIARNAHGMMIDGSAYQLRGLHTAESAEACAFKEGVRMAIENDWTHVVSEGDSATVVSRLDRRELDRSHTAAHLRNTISQLVDHPGYSFVFVKRDINHPAHGLAQLANNENIRFRFDFDIPLCIKHFVIEDAIFG
ncbi:hypothetical protein V6N13_027419 [Hibiscus sabdariffa]